MTKIIGITAIFLFACLLIMVLYSLILLNKRIPQQEIIVKVTKNTSTSSIVHRFNSFGTLQPKTFFIPFIRIYSILTNKTPISGTYRFTNENRNIDIIRSIFSGKQLSIVKVTYPEGSTVRDFARITQTMLGIDTNSFYQAINESGYIQKLKIPINSIEGYLMPETYFFYYETEAVTVVRKLVETQNKIWAEKFDTMCKEKGLSRHFVLTLASIIELESPLDVERARISGVFYNRLRKGMRLESDPTVQYALQQKKRLRTTDLDTDSRFNTYKYIGLPPGPICSPGISAIEAAINPENHNYYYFVAFGDGSGRHRFAKTYAEHLKIKRMFKQNLKKQSSTT
ncbi:MAG: endolytic transglycosylase MltG, partial [Candidatus Kapaibacteriota bacterium]